MRRAGGTGRIVDEVVFRPLLLLVENDLDRSLRRDLGQSTLRAEEGLPDQEHRCVRRPYDVVGDVHRVIDDAAKPATQ